MDSLQNFFLSEFLGNHVYQYIYAIVVFILMYFGLKILMHYISYGVKGFIKGNTQAKDVLLKKITAIPRYFFIIIEIFVALQRLSIHPIIEKIVNGILVFVIILQAISFIATILILVLNPLLKDKHRNKKQNLTVKTAIKNMVIIIVWVIGGLIFFENIGVEITPLIVSLGIASVAIAFALQNILEDIFSSFSIIFAPSFKVGDYVQVEGSKHGGSITDITLKNTRLETIYGQEIIIPNRLMLQQMIQNYGTMKYRRKRIDVTISYNTDPKKLEKVPDIIKKAISKQEECEFERAYLKEMGTYSIDFLMSYIFKQDTGYETSLRVGQEIYLEIIRLLAKEGIEIAFPTQTIHTPDIKK